MKANHIDAGEWFDDFNLGSECITEAPLPPPPFLLDGQMHLQILRRDRRSRRRRPIIRDIGGVQRLQHRS